MLYVKAPWETGNTHKNLTLVLRSWICSLTRWVRTWGPHTCRQAGRWLQDRGRGARRGEPQGGAPDLAWREVREPPELVPVGWVVSTRRMFHAEEAAHAKVLGPREPRANYSQFKNGVGWVWASML